MILTLPIAIAIGGALVAALPIAFVFGRRSGQRVGRAAAEAAQQAAGESAEQLAKKIRSDAEREADAARKQAVLAGKEEVMKVREAWEQEARKRREEIEREERRVVEREQQIDKKVDIVDQKDRDLGRRASELGRREKQLEERQVELDGMLGEERRRLEQLAGLSATEAKAKIVALADQRIAAEHTAEITASAVSLPKDDMKGRIIGREGRNIRAFELATGVDVIIDDTPDTVVVSCFDPVRREVARLALEKLVADGRIHPGRIEEVVEKSRKEVDASIIETGEQAAYEVGVHGLHPEMIKLIGRMKWRTSYGQNILAHSKEVAFLAGMMAAELGLDVAMAKRGALLHDVGKVLTHDHEGTHVQLGVEVATKYGESPLVVNCIAAHHDDVPHESEVSVLVQAADAISGSRPGARREAFETYVKRLEGLEKIASGYKGVDRVFAIQAGREVRVIVDPDGIDDARMQSLTAEIARRVESELQYPGQIKVVAIRETRASDIAR